MFRHKFTRKVIFEGTADWGEKPLVSLPAVPQPTCAGLAAILAVWAPVATFFPEYWVAVVTAACVGFLLGVLVDTRKSHERRAAQAVLGGLKATSENIRVVMAASRSRILPLTTIACHGLTLGGAPVIGKLVAGDVVVESTTTTLRLWIVATFCVVYALQELAARYIANHRINLDHAEVVAPPEPEPEPTGKRSTAPLAPVISIVPKNYEPKHTRKRANRKAA